MGRKPLKPDLNLELLQEELAKAVVASYNNPSPEERSDKDGAHKQLKILAEEFSMTTLKIRKILITAGAYSTETSEQIQKLYIQGYTVPQIQKQTGLSRASVQSYLPYRKGIYKTKEISTNAERIKRWRQRQGALKSLGEELATDTRCGRQ